jgi:bifunctional ADP-heptose synthase (sugar kinase/adenylyltransferase)
MINLKKQGIMLAGNILTDTVKMIKSYPEKGMLSTITSLKRAVGGSVPNSGIDLAVIDRALPVYACGMVGNDDNGDYVINEMQKAGINTEAVRRTDDSTSFSDARIIGLIIVRSFLERYVTGRKLSILPPDSRFIIKVSAASSE